MLSVAKPKFEKDLKVIMENAFYKAYMDTFLKSNTTSKSDGEANKAHEDIAKKFAKTMAEKATAPTVTAIYNFVKEIGITLNIPPSVIAPPSPPALPGGPCSGVIPLNNFTIS